MLLFQDVSLTQWITSEDINVEHLLDALTAIDMSASDVGEARVKFVEHLFWHKTQLTILVQQGNQRGGHLETSGGTSYEVIDNRER